MVCILVVWLRTALRGQRTRIGTYIIQTHLDMQIMFQCSCMQNYMNYLLICLVNSDQRRCANAPGYSCTLFSATLCVITCKSWSRGRKIFLWGLQHNDIYRLTHCFKFNIAGDNHFHSMDFQLSMLTGMTQLIISSLKLKPWLSSYSQNNLNPIGVGIPYMTSRNNFW